MEEQQTCIKNVNYDDKAFVIQSPIGIVLWHTLHVSRDECIRNFTEIISAGKKRQLWFRLRDEGYRCIKVGPIKDTDILNKEA